MSEMSESALPSASPAKWPTSVIRAGAILIVLVALPYAVFDLDRFFVPKELVLHLTALLTGLVLLGAPASSPAGPPGRRRSIIAA